MSSRDYFDEIASDWDGIRKGFFPDHVRTRALDIAGVSTGQIAADVGAGSGFVTEELLRRGLRVVALDQSEEMLRQMQAKFSGCMDVDYVVSEAGHLHLPDGSVDHALANMYLHHVPSPPDAIREMVRILKPGGRLVITDLDAHEFDFLRSEQHDRWMGFARSDVTGWLHEAGLHDVGIDCVGADCCADSCQSEGQAQVSIFVAWGTR
jgi:ubiquinone/menaquinone biosynthesis C-methylase UbiE